LGVENLVLLHTGIHVLPNATGVDAAISGQWRATGRFLDRRPDGKVAVLLENYQEGVGVSGTPQGQRGKEWKAFQFLFRDGMVQKNGFGRFADTQRERLKGFA
jgi:hypothetical protein